MTVRPEAGPCLRCIFPEPPDANQLPTCDTAGVLGPVASVVGSLQAAAAIRLLVGASEAGALLTMDVWHDRFKTIATAHAKRPDCPTCGQQRFQFLDAVDRDMTARLCGRNAVQVKAAPGGGRTSLTDLAKRLTAVGAVQQSAYMVRCQVEGPVCLTVFQDGRVLVQGTSDPGRARSLVARYIGL
jgi:adenylyltransferase/sulfurtransferase